MARKILGVALDKKVIIFCASAQNKLEQKRKGIDYFKQTIEVLVQKKTFNPNDLEILIFGNDCLVEWGKGLPFKMKSIGQLEGDYALSLAYSMADAFILTSIEDNFPNTVLESLACGIGVVSFKSGGISEMIEHKENGYLANNKDIYDLAAGIEWILKEDNSKKAAKSSRKKAADEYDLKAQAAKYLTIYEQALRENEKYQRICF